MSASTALAIFAAGLAAGTINTIVGSGSLITFPTLLAVGYPAVTANVTPYAFFLAAAGRAVGRATARDALLVGIPMSSREMVGADGELGCFANLVL